MTYRMTILATGCFFLLLLTCTVCTAAAAEPQLPPGIAWTRTYPDCDTCEAHAISRTSDGGYLVTGTSGSNRNGRSLLLLKTDSGGNKQWSTTGSGSSCEGNAMMAISPDNAAILGAGCGTNPGTVMLTFIENTRGAVQKGWNFESGGHATGTALISTGDGGYLILAEGDSRSAGRNDRDVMITRTDAEGKVLWTKIFSGTLNDTAKSVIRAPDGGYVIAGSTRNPVSSRDEFLLLRLDAQGTEQWVRTVGTEHDETAQSIVTAGDGGYVVAGTSCRRGTSGDCDIHAVRTDKSGTILWDRKFGGTGRDSAAVVLSSPEGGYVIAGSSDSPDRGALDRDVHIIHIDENGNEQWTSTFGTPSYETVTGAVFASDGSLVVTGYTTDPVDTTRRTLFMTSLGRAGRDPPPELIHPAAVSRKETGIVVRVRDQKSGAGIGGALVYYDGKSIGRTSDVDGNYLIEKPGTGSHSVRVTKPGYRETTVRTDGNTGSGLTVQLQPAVVQRISGDASPETALDIVFVPSGTSYDCSQQRKTTADQYIDHPETFLSDTRRLSDLTLLQLGKYSSVPARISGDYQKRLNIYYYWDGERYADAFNGCAGTLPEGFWDDAPFADVVIILYPQYYGPNKGSPCQPIGCTNGVGPGTYTWFKAPANSAPVFLHESGHAVFGLMDTYCGDTYYEENQPVPNVWQSVTSCNTGTSKDKDNRSVCRPITGGVTGSKTACVRNFWRYDQDPDLMAAINPSARFGESATQRIQYIFNEAGRGL